MTNQPETILIPLSEYIELKAEVMALTRQRDFYFDVWQNDVERALRPTGVIPFDGDEQAMKARLAAACACTKCGEKLAEFTEANGARYRQCGNCSHTEYNTHIVNTLPLEAEEKVVPVPPVEPDPEAPVL